MSGFARLADELTKDPVDSPVRLRRGVVSAVAGASATVTLGGASVAGIPFLNDYTLKVGDVVDVLLDGPAPRIIGVLGVLTWYEIGAVGAPAFQNSWVNELNRPAGYCRDAQGFVHLRGLIKTGAANTTAFTLPSGFRPAALEAFPIAINPGTIGQCNVNASGHVIPVVSSVTWTSLSGITFMADGS